MSQTPLAPASFFGFYSPLFHIPRSALNGPNDTGPRGVLIPTTSLDQFGGTCARWFGVTPSAMPSVFPNLANFPTQDLGFVG